MTQWDENGSKMFVQVLVVMNHARKRKEVCKKRHANCAITRRVKSMPK